MLTGRQGNTPATGASRPDRPAGALVALTRRGEGAVISTRRLRRPAGGSRGVACGGGGVGGTRRGGVEYFFIFNLFFNFILKITPPGYIFADVILLVAPVCVA